MRQIEGRDTPHYQPLCDLSVIYEGYGRKAPVHTLDLSASGMFIKTPQYLPEGAVLKLHFRLANSGFEVDARAEVRHCIGGVGVGVEFVEISPEAKRAIESRLYAPCTDDR